MGKVDFHKCNERLRDGGIFTTEHTEAAFTGTESDLGKGTETAIQSLNYPSAAASDLSTFRHELDQQKCAHWKARFCNFSVVSKFRANRTPDR